MTLPASNLLPADSESRVLTLCVPTYRRAVLLRRCLRAFQAEPLSAVCIIVGDNASPDDTPAIAGEFAHEPWLEYFRHPQNIGGDRNLLSIVERVRTPYFMILTDDDLPDVAGLRVLLNNLARYPNAAAVIPPLCSVRDDLLVVHVRGPVRRTHLVPPGLGSAFRNAHLAWAWSRLVFKRECFDLAAAWAAVSNCYFMVQMMGLVCRKYPVLLQRERTVLHTIDNEVFWEGIDPDVIVRALKLEVNILTSLRVALAEGGMAGRLARLYFTVRVTRQYIQRGDGFAAYIRQHGLSTRIAQNAFIAREFGYEGSAAALVPLVRLWAVVQGAVIDRVRQIRVRLRR